MGLNSFQKTAISTVIATLVLILIGGLVRAAGAGLGCPDWPTCFGMWIPPTTAEALPPGFDATQFNPFHTWLEYVNRLAGVIIGLLITATFLLSFRYRKSDRVIVITSGIAFLLVLLQGWLGGVVVRSGLSAGMITLHMLLAMILVNLLLYSTFRASSGLFNITLEPHVKRGLKVAVIVVLILTVIQLILGTQVREAVDVLKNAPDPLPRDRWLEEVNHWLYVIHRSFSWLIVLAGGALVTISRRFQISGIVQKTVYAVVLLIVVQIFIGAGMDWLGIPGVLQLLHLVSVALLICTEFLLLLMVLFSKKHSDEFTHL